MTDNAPPVLDTTTALKRLKGDKAFLEMLLQVFLDDLPQKLDALASAVDQPEMELVQRTSHSLKGACATIGAEALRAAASELETASRDEDTQAIRKAYGPIPALAQDLMTCLRQELG